MKVIMPQIGMTMQEGIINQWFKHDGEQIEKGEKMVEIGTEKLTNEIEAPASGIFHPIANVGDSIPCGDPIAEIEE